MISCIIPTTIGEERYLSDLLNILLVSGRRSGEEFEIIIIENGRLGKTKNIVERKKDPHLKYAYLIVPSRSKAKNFGVEIAKGEILIFLDADNGVSLELFSEVAEKGRIAHFFGGGCKGFKFSREALGIKLYFLFMLIIFTLKGVWNPLNPFSVGIFWFKKEHYNKIGGWRDVNLKEISSLLSFIPESIQAADDVDLGKRMKDYEKQTGLKFESLKQTTCFWNTRKFDLLGDWSWLSWRNMR